MCVVNKQFVFDSVYVDLQYDEISITFTAGSVSLCCVCCAISCPLWSSVYECQRVECAFTSPVRTECGMSVSAVL